MSITKNSKPSKDSCTATIGFAPALSAFVQSEKLVESHGGKLLFNSDYSLNFSLN